MRASVFDRDAVSTEEGECRETTARGTSQPTCESLSAEAFARESPESYFLPELSLESVVDGDSLIRLDSEALGPAHSAQAAAAKASTGHTEIAVVLRQCDCTHQSQLS